MSATGRRNLAANSMNFDDDESIPLLTERLTLPALDLDFALPALEQAVQSEPGPAVTATVLPPVELPPPPPIPPTAALPTPEEIRDMALQAVLDGLPAQMKSSMQGDLELGGRLEVEWLSGAVVRMAAEAGVEAPVHRSIYAALKRFAGGTSQR